MGDTLSTCPACSQVLAEGATECPGCGIVLAKWRGREARPRRPAALPPPPPLPPPPSAPRRHPARRFLLLLALGLAGGGLAGAAYWVVKIRPRLELIENPQSAAEPERAGRLRAREQEDSDFDRRVELPIDPLGLAAGNGVMLVGHRADGFLRLRPAGEDLFEAETVSVLENLYHQHVAFWAVTWNGEQFVGYTDGTWFQRQGESVFTLLDADDLKIKRVLSAPPQLGCLAWDGSGYWAATRRNTADADEETFLYRLDRDLQVVSKSEPPGVGCQGMVWDGKLLWLADVFSDNLYLLDVSGSEPELVHSQPTEVTYLSGIAIFDGHLWVSEYGDDQLHRLNPRRRAQWVKTRRPPPGQLEDPQWAMTAPPSLTLDDEEIERLRRELRSDDDGDRMSAEMRLEQAGELIDYDRNQDEPSSPLGPEDTHVWDFAAELTDGELFAWWKVYFGDGLFESERHAELLGEVITLPLFAKFTVSVDGGSLREEIEHEVVAEPGDNIGERVLLASDLGPGEYRVSLFIHVQYITPEGTGQILNRSSFGLEVDG